MADPGFDLSGGGLDFVNKGGVESLKMLTLEISFCMFWPYFYKIGPPTLGGRAPDAPHPRSASDYYIESF